MVNTPLLCLLSAPHRALIRARASLGAMNTLKVIRVMGVLSLLSLLSALSG